MTKRVRWRFQLTHAKSRLPTNYPRTVSYASPLTGPPKHIMRPLFLWLLVTLQNPNIARKQNIKHSPPLTLDFVNSPADVAVAVAVILLRRRDHTDTHTKSRFVQKRAKHNAGQAKSEHESREQQQQQIHFLRLTIYRVKMNAWSTEVTSILVRAPRT